VRCDKPRLLADVRCAWLVVCAHRSGGAAAQRAHRGSHAPGGEAQGCGAAELTGVRGNHRCTELTGVLRESQVCAELTGVLRNSQVCAEITGVRGTHRYARKSQVCACTRVGGTACMRMVRVGAQAETAWHH